MKNRFLKQAYINMRKKINYYKRYNQVKTEIIRQYKSTNKPIIYLFICPQYRNLGDHAIVETEKQFVEEKCKGYEIIDIYLEDTDIAKDVIKKIIRKNDIVAFNGGGYIGDEYLHAEKMIRKLLKVFKENKCIMFPQTIFFSDTKNGVKEFEKTIKSYSSHPNLTIVTREEKSYNICKSRFKKNNIIICPDIVFYYTPQENIDKRTDITICLRDDVEKVLKEDDEIKIIEFIKSKYKNVVITDTVCKHDVKREKRKENIESILKQFYKSKLIITDRIHGMIFATITNTPCIVMSNYNHKVKETYKWIKHLNYIKFIEDISDIEDIIISLVDYTTDNKYDKFNKDEFEKYYNNLANIINAKE